MKESITKCVITAAMAGIGLYMHELLIPVLILAVVMILDYGTGIVGAWMSGQLCSRVGVLGIVKKLAYLCAVAVAIVIDWVIQNAAGRTGLDLGSFYAFGLIVTIWLILNECISILENIAEMGVPLPAFLLAVIKKLKKTTETRGDAMVGEEDSHDQGH